MKAWIGYKRCGCPVHAALAVPEKPPKLPKGRVYELKHLYEIPQLQVCTHA